MRSLLDMTKVASGKYEEMLPEAKVPRTVTREELDEFKSLLTFDEVYIEGLRATSDYEEFFKAFELLEKMVPKDLQEDIFYAAKLGFFFNGVPSRLVYLLNTAVKKYDTPNNILSSIDMRSFQKYWKGGYLPKDVTIKDILEELLGHPVELLSEYKRCVKYRDWFEVYIENTDRVAILPADMESVVKTVQDVKNITYVKDVGLCLGPSPLRLVNGRIGLTKDEYDLRECK